MSSALISRENETFPNRIRWTVEEYYRLADSKFLKGRYELIDGEIISKMGQNPPHRLAVVLIANWLVSVFGGLRVQQQSPIAILTDEGEYTEPEPDIAVTSQPATSYLDRNPSSTELELVVEVSDSTSRFDLNVKSLVYARAGVREYWVVDIVNRRLHIHLLPGSAGYREITGYSDKELVSATASPESKARLADLLPPAEKHD